MFLLSCAVFIANTGGVHAKTIVDPAQNLGFVPHKALYEIRLSSRRSNANVSDIKGQMAYEWTSSCDAWITAHRFDITYNYLEAPPMRLTSEFSTHESFDGNSFNFSSQRKHDDQVIEEIRGVANHSEGEGDARAIYSIPKELAFDLPDNTLFPMAHTMDLLRALKDGQRFHNKTLFDGSDEDGPVAVNSFVGKKSAPVTEESITENMDMALLAAQGWRVRLAFFPLHEFETTSDYEMSAIFHENGVISDMEIEYKDFSITQKLIALEPLSNTCDK